MSNEEEEGLTTEEIYNGLSDAAKANFDQYLDLSDLGLFISFWLYSLEDTDPVPSTDDLENILINDIGYVFHLLGRNPDWEMLKTNVENKLPSTKSKYPELEELTIDSDFYYYSIKFFLKFKDGILPDRIAQIKRELHEDFTALPFAKIEPKFSAAFGLKDSDSEYEFVLSYDGPVYD